MLRDSLQLANFFAIFISARIHGKNKKQRALFIVDKLYGTVVAYLKDPQSP